MNNSEKGKGRKNERKYDGKETRKGIKETYKKIKYCLHFDLVIQMTKSQANVPLQRHFLSSVYTFHNHLTPVKAIKPQR